MSKLVKIVVSSLLLLESCTPQMHKPAYFPVSENVDDEAEVVKMQETSQVGLNLDLFSCPENMANIDNEYCIDRWEASIVDKDTGNFASPNYIASRKGFSNAGKQYDHFKDLKIDKKVLAKLLKTGQPTEMPERGAEQFPSFVPKAVSLPGRIPASYVNKKIAEEACENAGKRLCARKEWYKACVGPSGPDPYEPFPFPLPEDVEIVFPNSYPYGEIYEKEKCNMGRSRDHWPPGILGRKNNGQMMDPRIGTLFSRDGNLMKIPTGSFPECTNSYGVYDMVGNVHEIVSDTIHNERLDIDLATFVGSHYARFEKQDCSEITQAHWSGYTDYSLGFRCCAEIINKE